MSTERCDVLVIGGGLVGLATVMHLQIMRPQLRMVVVEKERAIATHQSGRSSGVAHAGIYYQPGSMKAKLCVEGKEALRQYCAAKDIAYRACGKVIVATNQRESARLDDLLERGIANGVPGLRLIDGDELREVEPRVAGIRALHSPESAIVDYRQVASAYAADFAAGGGDLRVGAEFLEARDRTAAGASWRPAPAQCPRGSLSTVPGCRQTS